MPRVRVRERGIAAYDRDPWPATRILAERFRAASRQRDDLRQTVLLHVREMLREAQVTGDPVLRTAHRPPEQEAARRLRVRDAEGDRRGASHAATHDMRAIDIQMTEQSVSLPHVVGPRDALDAAARRAGLAAVEDDALKVLRQVIENLDPRVDAERRPLLERRVEAAGREHQQRHAAADDFVARADAVDGRRCHQAVRTAGAAPRICRAARTSSPKALIAFSVTSATFA